MKKILFVAILMSSFLANAQGLTPEEQKKLQQDVEILKRKTEALESQKGMSAADTAQSQQMLETIKKGQAFQAEQAKALEELDKDN